MLHKCNRVTLGFLVLKHHFTQRIYIFYIYIFIYIFTHTRAHTQKKSLIGFLCSNKNSWQLQSVRPELAFVLPAMPHCKLSLKSRRLYLSGRLS